MAEQGFDSLFKDAYNRARSSQRVMKSIRASEAIQTRDSIQARTPAVATLGHPDYEYLEVGETASGKAVILFLDIRGFTKLSFALPNDELAHILQALTDASVKSVLQFGGHVIEFTGDGVMAVFGDSKTTDENAAFASLHTAAFLMKGIRDYVNPQLQQWGTEPVRTAMGLEFGDVLWTRIGVMETSQVKPISEATFLAGKLSTGKFTGAWEAKVGEDLASWIPEDFKLKAEKPYKFTLNNVDYSRDLYLFRWEQFGQVYLSRANELRGRMVARNLAPVAISGARTATPGSTGTSARLLKDQPFF